MDASDSTTNAGLPAERLPAAFLLFLSVLIGAVGLMYLADPVGSMVAAEILLDSPASLTEIRGMYGGLHIALSAFMFSCNRQGSRHYGLALASLVFGSVAAGRVLSFGLEQSVDAYNLLVTLAEVVLSAVGFVLYRAVRPSPVGLGNVTAPSK